MVPPKLLRSLRARAAHRPAVEDHRLSQLIEPDSHLCGLQLDASNLNLVSVFTSRADATGSGCEQSASAGCRCQASALLQSDQSDLQGASHIGSSTFAASLYESDT
eukprot:TRINITY_DN24324_c0_g1_i1.p3 TRINITY_DN24324_c0_g1~~TRINITY_DN24324_c0_g1_i1.p3  ORF type:complete len:106 (+),score=16.08 TRINITY_DN24324_c0_g1_i1:1224-1541(+)